MKIVVKSNQSFHFFEIFMPQMKDLICFAGSDLVDWLHTHVEGFADRRDARKYACNLLKAGYIRHTVNKLTFSEQCYYVFGDYLGGKNPIRIVVVCFFVRTWRKNSSFHFIYLLFNAANFSKVAHKP